MPLEQSEAIILRSFNVGEQDKIVVFFSRDKGIMRGVAKGARKFGNRFGSSLEPMSFVKIFYYEKEIKDLVTVSNCDIIESFFDIQKDLKANFTLSFFAELVEEFFPSRAKEDILFRLLVSILQAIKAGGDLNFLTAYFEAWFVKINGFLPNLKKCKKCHKDIIDIGWLSPKKDGIYCGHCATHRKEKIMPLQGSFLQWIKKNPPSEKGSLPFSTSEIEAIRKILEEIIIFHLEKEPKTLQYLKSAV